MARKPARPKDQLVESYAGQTDRQSGARAHVRCGGLSALLNQAGHEMCHSSAATSPRKLRWTALKHFCLATMQYNVCGQAIATYGTKR